MTKHSKPIIVGVQNDENDNKVLEVAAKLSQKFDCPITLVHAHEPTYSSYRPVLAGSDIINLFGKLDDYTLEESAQKLKKTAEDLKVQAKIKVMTGHPSGCIIAEAMASDAWMILVGARPGSHSFAFKSQSVPLSLFNESPLPVMVVNDEISSDWNISDALHLVSADDLARLGHGPTGFAARLAARYGETAELKVFHVNPLGENILKSGIESALAAAYSQPTPAISAEKIHQILNESIKTSLDKQIPADLKDQIRWRSEIVTGTPERELSDQIKRDKPHIAVFGKHKTLHLKPFYFGKLPFATAFSLNTPFIIVPD